MWFCGSVFGLFVSLRLTKNDHLSQSFSIGEIIKMTFRLQSIAHTPEPERFGEESILHVSLSQLQKRRVTLVDLAASSTGATIREAPAVLKCDVAVQASEHQIEQKEINDLRFALLGEIAELKRYFCESIRALRIALKRRGEPRFAKVSTKSAARRARRRGDPWK